jgi:hypothetical protein
LAPISNLQAWTDYETSIFGISQFPSFRCCALPRAGAPWNSSRSANIKQKEGRADAREVSGGENSKVHSA